MTRSTTCIPRGRPSDEYRELERGGDRRPRGPSLPEALLDADSFEDLSGKWQAAILDAEQNRPKLRLVSDA